MNSLFNIAEFQTPEILSYTRGLFDEVNSRKQYIGPTLLPFKNVEELEWKYIVGTNAAPIPVMAKIKALDAESSVATRKKTLTSVAGEIPSIARKIAIDGATLIKLSNPRTRSNEYNEAIAEVYNDNENMLVQVAARAEWLRCQTIFQGSFDYDEDNVEFSVDFGMNSDLQLTFADAQFTTQTAWTDNANSNPVQMLMEAVKIYRGITGINPGRIIGSDDAIFHILQNANTVKMAFGSNESDRLMTNSSVERLLREQKIPVPVPYEVQVAVENGKTVTPERLLPNNRLVFLPPADVPLGETLFGPTIEEVMDPDVQALNDPDLPRLFSQVYVEGKDPGRLWTKVVGNLFPTFPGADLVMHLDVW